jgi:hypothetical protein
VWPNRAGVWWPDAFGGQTTEILTAGDCHLIP